MLPVAVPWFESDADFEAVCAMITGEESADPVPFSELVAIEHTKEQKIRDDGQWPVRITVKAAAVKAWCDARDLPVSQISLAQYCVDCLGRQVPDWPLN